MTGPDHDRTALSSRGTLAERRDNGVLVDFVQHTPLSIATCAVQNPGGSIDVDDITVDRSNTEFGGFEPNPAQLGFPPDSLSFTHGVVGTNVAGVTIHAGEDTAITTVKGVTSPAGGDALD